MLIGFEYSEGQLNILKGEPDHHWLHDLAHVLGRQ